MHAAPRAVVNLLDRCREKVLKPVVVVGLLLIAVRWDALLRKMAPTQMAPAESIEQSLNPTAARVLSFGHLPVLVDGLLVRGLAEASTEIVTPGVHPTLYYLLDLATRLDPLQFELYWFGSNILSIVRRDGAGADLLLERSHTIVSESRYPEPGFQERHWAYAWQLELMRGYNALFELQDFEKARESFELASRLPGALPFLGPLSQKLASREGRIEVADRTLSSLLRRKNPPEVQAQLEERNRELGLARFLLALEKGFVTSKSRSFEAFLRTRGISADPQGGSLSWNPDSGRIWTTSPLGKLGSLYQ